MQIILVNYFGEALEDALYITGETDTVMACVGDIVTIGIGITVGFTFI